MAFAVSLFLDAALSDAVSERWRRLADAGLSHSMLDLAYPPHVTLSVSEELDARAATLALDDVFGRINPIGVTLTGISTFGPDGGVCYAALAPSPELDRLHEKVQAVAGETCRPHYRVGHWTPHCTLAMNLSAADLGRAIDLLARDWRPLSGVFEAADFVEFKPIAGIRRWSLPISRSDRPL